MIMAVACGWGFAEATLFFLVPDIWLSYLALVDLRRALRASLWTVGGSLLGGIVMYLWSANDPPSALNTVEHLPAIGAQMLARGATMLHEQGVWSLFPGMLRGLPYKVFAVQAPHAAITLPVLLLATIPARLARFALVSVMTRIIATRVLRSWSRRAQVLTLTAFWVVFYAMYFAIHAG